MINTYVSISYFLANLAILSHVINPGGFFVSGYLPNVWLIATNVFFYLSVFAIILWFYQRYIYKRYQHQLLLHSSKLKVLRVQCHRYDQMFAIICPNTVTLILIYIILVGGLYLFRVLYARIYTNVILTTLLVTFIYIILRNNAKYKKNKYKTEKMENEKGKAKREGEKKGEKEKEKEKEKKEKKKSNNPFVYEEDLQSKWWCLELAIGSIIFMPMRVYLFLCSLLLSWIFALCILFAQSKIAKRQEMEKRSDRDNDLSQDHCLPTISAEEQQLREQQRMDDLNIYVQTIEVFRNLIKFSARLTLLGMGGWYVKTTGKKADAHEAPIVVANHSGFYDSVLLVCHYLPSIVMATEYKYIPAIGAVVRANDGILIDRASVDSRSETAIAIKNRAHLCLNYSTSKKLSSTTKPRQVMLFPEGTTTNGKSLISFKPGAFAAGVPVQACVFKFPRWTPCWVGAGPQLAGMFFRMFSAFSTPVEMHFLPPMTSTMTPTMTSQTITHPMTFPTTSPMTPSITRINQAIKPSQLIARQRHRGVQKSEYKQQQMGPLEQQPQKIDVNYTQPCFFPRSKEKENQNEIEMDTDIEMKMKMENIKEIEMEIVDDTHKEEQKIDSNEKKMVHSFSEIVRKEMAKKMNCKTTEHNYNDVILQRSAISLNINTHYFDIECGKYTPIINLTFVKRVLKQFAHSSSIEEDLSINTATDTKSSIPVDKKLTNKSECGEGDKTSKEEINKEENKEKEKQKEKEKDPFVEICKLLILSFSKMTTDGIFIDLQLLNLKIQQINTNQNHTTNANDRASQLTDNAITIEEVMNYLTDEPFAQNAVKETTSREIEINKIDKIDEIDEIDKEWKSELINKSEIDVSRFIRRALYLFSHTKAGKAKPETETESTAVQQMASKLGVNGSMFFEIQESSHKLNKQLLKIEDLLNVFLP